VKASHLGQERQEHTMHDCIKTGRTINTLIIEDNEGDVRLFEIMMRNAENMSFVTRHSDTIASARVILESEKFDIVLLDLGLPDSQGLATVSTMLKHCAEIPVIVLTGLNDEKMGIEAVRLGAQDYLVKGETNTKLLVRSICYTLERKEVEKEKKSLRSQLLQAQKVEALGTLASGIAHDFNNILTIIQRNLEAAKAFSDNEKEWTQALEAAEEARKTGSDLVKRLLQFGRPTKSGTVVVSLNQIVLDTLAFLKAVIPAQISIEHHLCPEACTIKADPSTISHIITNLCINARDAMPDGGTLTIAISRVTVSEEYCKAHKEAIAGEFCVLKVSDTGTGIPCGIIERVFEPFFTTKDEGKGTGLGLSIVYSTVKSLGGWIQCKSSEGQGTEFILHFPLAEEERKDDISLEDRGIPGKARKADGEKETVLFADDQEILLHFGSKVLEDNGYKVYTADDGEKALALFREKQNEISIAILDLEMPRMGGLQVMEEIKKISPKTPVIFISNHTYENIAELSGGKACDILSKDYSPSEMLAFIRNVLDRTAQNGSC